MIVGTVVLNKANKTEEWLSKILSHINAVYGCDLSYKSVHRTAHIAASAISYDALSLLHSRGVHVFNMAYDKGCRFYTTAESVSACANSYIGRLLRVWAPTDSCLYGAYKLFKPHVEDIRIINSRNGRGDNNRFLLMKFNGCTFTLRIELYYAYNYRYNHCVMSPEQSHTMRVALCGVGDHREGHIPCSTWDPCSMYVYIHLGRGSLVTELRSKLGFYHCNSNEHVGQTVHIGTMGQLIPEIVLTMAQTIAISQFFSLMRERRASAELLYSRHLSVKKVADFEQGQFVDMRTAVSHPGPIIAYLRNLKLRDYITVSADVASTDGESLQIDKIGPFMEHINVVLSTPFDITQLPCWHAIMPLCVWTFNDLRAPSVLYKASK